MQKCLAKLIWIKLIIDVICDIKIVIYVGFYQGARITAGQYICRKKIGFIIGGSRGTSKYYVGIWLLPTFSVVAFHTRQIASPSPLVKLLISFLTMF